MSFTREQWCRDVLNLLGNTSPSDLLINFMVGWTVSETKTDSGARFNLLNSTHKALGSTDFNTTGVQNYISYEQGIQMTVETLNGKYYPSLLSALKNNTLTNPLSLDILANLHMWCGGCGYGENFVHLGELHRNDTFTGDVMQINKLLNNNCFPGQNNPRYIILHGTAGGASALNIAQYFKGTEGGNNPTSAHYIIDQSGVIYQCNSEDDGAWANGVVSVGHDPWWNVNGNPNPNNITISIEHVKPDTANATPLTPAQQAASFALVADICERRGIPKRPADALGGVTGHFSIDPVNRARCPGPYPWDALWAHLAGNQPEEIVTIDLKNPTVASHFTGDANQWTCKETKFTLHGEILTFYQSFGGNALCGLTHLGLPLSAETPILSKPGTVYQRFERGVLAFDPNKLTDNPPGSGRVYLLHIDSGLGQDPRIAQLQAQIDTLKNLPVVTNLQQITTISQRIRDDVNLVVKLATVN